MSYQRSFLVRIAILQQWEKTRVATPFCHTIAAVISTSAKGHTEYY